MTRLAALSDIRVRWALAVPIAAALAVGRPGAVAAAGALPGAVAVTVYSTAEPGAIAPEFYRPAPQSAGAAPAYGQPVPGYAMVKQERELSIDADRATVRFADVAALIDPTTVAFVSLTDPAGTHVVEQNYQFDLVSTAKLMERYIDREISVEQVAGAAVTTFTGTLLSTAGGLVLHSPDKGVQVLTHYANARFPELPGGLITRPTLVWEIAAQKKGTHKTRVTYQTGGITWWADYNLVFAEGRDANHGALDVGAWVSILNQSGATYPNATLKLVAGDVHRAARPAAMGAMMRQRAMMDAAAEGFAEKPFFEYHLYTLGRPATLPDHSTKQIELLPAVRSVPAEKVLVYYGLEPHFRGFFPDPVTDRSLGAQTNKKVDVYLRFKNAKEVGLGMPMPSGRVRISKLDPSDGSLEFIGEDTIDHTPKDETVLIQLGSAFDIVGERKQVDFTIDTARKVMEERIEIALRNHKDAAVDVVVKENLYRWSTWKITEKTHDYEKVDARTIEFPVNVPAGGATAVRYAVRYTW